MVQGPMLLVILLIAIVMIVALISRFKVHAFLALLFASFFVGLAAGMNPVDVSKTIMKGFGGTAERIGIVPANGGAEFRGNGGSTVSDSDPGDAPLTRNRSVSDAFLAVRGGRRERRNDFSS